MVADRLTCPYCAAVFTFDEWRRDASCPACRRRVDFRTAAAPAAPPVAAPTLGSELEFAASPALHPPSVGDAGASPTEPPAAGTAVTPVTPIPAVSGGPATSRSSPSRRRTAFGKPLGWTRAWTAVALVWLVLAVGLAAARVEMGHLTALTRGEQAAIEIVENGRLQPGVGNRQLLDYLPTYFHDPLVEVVGGRWSGGRPHWYSWYRPWEKKYYVSYTFETSSGTYVLSWTVQGDRADPEAETELFLKRIAQHMQPSAPSGPVPGLPSL